MNSQIYYIAKLSIVDASLDELKEEFGDLPDRIKQIKEKTDQEKAMVDETVKILDELKKFASSSKNTLQTLKTREEKLAKQQFLVRNNKEFDAITKEIESSRNEYNRLIEELRTVGVKEENLIRTLEQQKKDYAETKKSLDETEAELKEITSDQNDEVKGLMKKRKEFVKNINAENIALYEHIRLHTKDTAVRIRKNSCSGCFSAIPPQKIVEIRNNLERLFLCENCGRVLYPEGTQL